MPDYPPAYSPYLDQGVRYPLPTPGTPTPGSVDATYGTPAQPPVFEPAYTNAPRWFLERIRARLENGFPVADPSGPNTLTQWMDTPESIGWTAEVNRLLALPFVAPYGGVGENPTSPPTWRNAQWLGRISDAIANTYNALNIPWYNDPVARELWRRYFAGPPESGTDTNNRRNYNENWYKANENYPQTSPTAGLAVGTRTGRFGGIITGAAQDEFQRSYPVPSFAPTHPSEFRQMAGVYTDVQEPRGGEPREDVRISSHLINHGFAYYSLTPEPIPYRGPQYLAASSPSGLDGNHVSVEAAVVCVPPASSIADCMAGDGWSTLRFVIAAGAGVAGEFNPNVPLPMWPRMETYLPWFREWAASLARGPFQIVLDARRFAMIETMKGIQAAGGDVMHYLQGIAAANTDIFDQAHAQNTALQVAAAVAGTLGAAVGTVTAGVGTVIGAAVAAGLLVIDAVNIEQISGHGKDDLGRYKPVLERGWLDGDPFTDDRTRGAPSARLWFPNPPGYVPPPREEYPAQTGPVEAVTLARRLLAQRLQLPETSLPPISALSYSHASQILSTADPVQTFKNEYCMLPSGGLRTQQDTDWWNTMHPWCPAQRQGAGVGFLGSTGGKVLGIAVLVGAGYLGYRMLSRPSGGGGRREGDR